MQDESGAEFKLLRVLGSCSEQGRGSSGAKRSESGRRYSHILVSGLYSETPGSKAGGVGAVWGVGSGSPGLGSGSIKEVCFSGKICSYNLQSCRFCNLLMGEMRRLCVCVCACVHVSACDSCVYVSGHTCLYIHLCGCVSVYSVSTSVFEYVSHVAYACVALLCGSTCLSFPL